MSQSTFTPSIEPLIPSDKAIENSQLIALSAKIALLCDSDVGLKRVNGEIVEPLEECLIAYHSNLIENIVVPESDMLNALNGVFSPDPISADLQKMAIAPVLARRALRFFSPNQTNLFTLDSILEIHAQLFKELPSSAKVINGELDSGGRFRNVDVKVGQHLAPEWSEVPSLLDRFCSVYSSFHPNHQYRFISVAAAHHRLMWIHPFADGNGRVARVFSEWLFHHFANQHPGTMHLNHAIAATAKEYRKMLAHADMQRQSANDGRGARSERALIDFCEYFLSVMIKALESE